MSGRWSARGDRRQRVRLRDRAGEASYPSIPSCLSPYCINMINCSLLVLVLSRNLLQLTSTKGTDVHGDLDG